MALLLTLSLVSISIFSACATDKSQTVTKNNDQFRASNRHRTTTPRVTVVCRSCQASFKLSPRIQKLSMKGDAHVACPVCHKDYLSGKNI